MSDSFRRRLRAIARALCRGLAYIARGLYDGLIVSGLSFGDPYAV